ncbi:MAG: hypothetical protein VX899_26965 [Myxococcota bacterium]|nr:hypothetical protein [Myxococcota bacterium]
MLFALTLLACEKDAVDDTAIGADWDVELEMDSRGMFMSVWGAASDDVWIVGGQEDQGLLLRGAPGAWESVALPDDTPMLTWVSGQAADDVWVAGLGGTLLHWDGASFTDHSQPIEGAFWGVHPLGDQVLAVGGQFRQIGDGPVMYRMAEGQWEALDLPSELSSIESLFKVWRDGEDFVSVGADGVSLRVTPDGQVTGLPSGSNKDMVTVHSQNGDTLVAVGGRSYGAVWELDGDTWSQTAETNAGLSGLWDVGDGRIVCVGERGIAGIYDRESQSFTENHPFTSQLLHAVWVDDQGTVIAVGGDFVSDEFTGTLVTSDRLL